MPVDFEAERLLDDLRDSRERAKRIALLHHLQHRACRAAADGRLVSLAVGAFRLRASFGLAVPAADERVPGGEHEPRTVSPASARGSRWGARLRRARPGHLRGSAAG